MPYYRAGDYYRGGDYYGRNYAAGGLGSFLKSALGKVAKIGLGTVLGGPLGGIAAGLPGGGLAQKLLRAGPALAGRLVPGTAGKALMLGGNVQNALLERAGLLPGNFGGGAQRVAQLGPGPSPFGGGVVGPPLPDGFSMGGRRRMNVTNVRALRRAGRRVKGFLKLARRLGALPVGGSGKKLFKTKRRK